jgi:CRP/FNR family transcriptional regulator, anaerobic regulatory protein
MASASRATDIDGAAPALRALYPALALLPPDELAATLRDAQRLAVPTGTVLFEQGQSCALFPLILKGTIRVSKPAANGRELPLYRLCEGDTCVITSACLLGGAAYSARGIAETDLDLVALPRQRFLALLDHVPFRDFVFCLFSERIAELMQVVEEVAFRKLDERLAALLLGKGRIVHATHQQLADELGSVREMVTRLLKGFSEARLVRLGREQIEILDAQALRGVASRHA